MCVYGIQILGCAYKFSPISDGGVNNTTLTPTHTASYKLALNYLLKRQNSIFLIRTKITLGVGEAHQRLGVGLSVNGG